jgi:hypothetical protein
MVAALLSGGLFLASAPLPAQRTAPQSTRQASADRPAYDPTLYSDGTRTNRACKSLRWRLVGPFRGGRVTAVTGDPAKPLVFYFGAVNGGVWKTTNAGQSWHNVTDGKTDISSVGAIAVAPSDPNVIWVGSGEGKPREDLTYGTGVYRSTDGGDLSIDVTNPRILYASMWKFQRTPWGMDAGAGRSGL